MPYHITVGVLTFALSMVTTVLGVCEKVMFALYVYNIISDLQISKEILKL